MAAAAAADLYPSNTALYADPGLAEGTDYARRYRRHGLFDDSEAATAPVPQTVVVAPHGGGIEPGTSELCLAIAGYHPASLAGTPPVGPVYDYWMFEGIRSTGNAGLHVTSTNCDDPAARSFCAGARRAVTLHGCTEGQAGVPSGSQAVLVGGRDATFKSVLCEEFAAVGLWAIDAAGNEALKGDNVQNIVNRTLLGMGAQLEITTAMRTAMFGTNTRAQRKNTTTATFWAFVAAARTAIARIEAA